MSTSAAVTVTVHCCSYSHSPLLQLQSQSSAAVTITVLCVSATAVLGGECTVQITVGDRVFDSNFESMGKKKGGGRVSR